MLDLKVYCDKDYPPFDFIDKDGNPTGFNVDITKKIAECMNFKVNFEMTEWNKAIKKFAENDTNIIHGVAKSFSRGNFFNFTEEYIIAFNSIFKLRENKKIENIKDLSNKLIAVQKNDVSYDAVKEIKNIKIVEVSSQKDAIRMLFNGDVDAIAGNRMTVLFYAREMNKSGLIMSIGEPLCITKISIGVSKQRNDILNLFNEGIEKIKKDGTYKQLCSKWFGEQLKDLDKQLLESVETGIICVSSLGIITAMNKTACKILDIKIENTLFRSVYETDIIKFVDSLSIQNALDNIENSYMREITCTIDKKRKDLSINLFPLPDCNGNIDGIIINLKDVTKEKLAERELITNDKMESLGRLILNVAHEIRNPLTSIKNFISLIPDNIDDMEFRETLLKYVPSQIDMLDKILSELLEYSSPRLPDKTDINVKETVESILKMINPRKNIMINLDIEEGLKVIADKMHFKQILINIILNSIDAIDDKGIIDIVAIKKGKNGYITIANNGKGIPDEDINLIFDPFYTTKENGTGLGLYITYQLIKQNSGDISVESNESGTKTTLKFIAT